MNTVAIISAFLCALAMLLIGLLSLMPKINERKDVNLYIKNRKAKIVKLDAEIAEAKKNGMEPRESMAEVEGIRGNLRSLTVNQDMETPDVNAFNRQLDQSKYFHLLDTAGLTASGLGFIGSLIWAYVDRN